MQLAYSFANRRLRRALTAVVPAFFLLCFSGSTFNGNVNVAAPGATERRHVPSRSPLGVAGNLKQGKTPGKDLRLASNGQTLEVDLRSGEYRELNFEQKGVDLEIVVFAPSGNLLFKVDSPSGDWGPELVPLLGDPAGRYRLKVTGTGSGTYRLSATRVRRARDRDRKCVLAVGVYWRGRALIQENRIAEAEEELQSSRRLWRECGNPSGEADAIYKIAGLQESSRQWEEALSSFSSALSIYRRLKRLQVQAYIFNAQGSIYDAHLGQSEGALKAYAEALKISQERGFLKISATVLNNRSKLRENLGDPAGALQDAETASQIARVAGLVDEEIRAENLKGEMYRVLGEPEEALRRHQRMRQHLLGSPKLSSEMAATFVHLGDDYRSLRKWEDATSSYLEGIKLWRRLRNPGEEATALNNLSIVYSQTHRWDEARETLRRVREIHESLNDRSDVAVTSVNLAWILASLGHYEEAQSLYRDALEMFEESHLRPNQAVAYFGLGWIEWKRGNLNEAQRLLEKALAIIEDIRVRAESRAMWGKFLTRWQNFYSLLVEVLMGRHEREPGKGFDLQAFQVSERARCRALLESVEGRIVLPSLSWKELQGTLDEDTVLLEYSLGEERSFLWVVTRDSLNSYVLPGQSEIQALALKVHGLLAESYDEKIRRKLISQTSELSRILFGPVAERLSQKRVLVVAPPELQYIPFAVLPQLPVTFPLDDPWPVPWLTRFEITSEPSTTFLATLRRLRKGRKPAPNLLALVGGPLYSAAQGRKRAGVGAQLSHLRFSRREVLSIAQDAGKRATCFLGSEANRDLVLRGGLKPFRMLHFSVHGLLATDDPQESALVLSGLDRNGREVENRLRAREIARLELPADLVVLSACSTGLGAEIRGEGLVGLAQAFFSAGASSIVASLWNVDDFATSQLMTSFYKNMLQGGLPPAAALREAQLTLRKQKRYRSPYYWSGFVLQGEWNEGRLAMAPKLP